MEKIYSRRRIQMPRIVFSKFSYKKDVRKLRAFKVAIALVIAIVVMVKLQLIHL